MLNAFTLIISLLSGSIVCFTTSSPDYGILGSQEVDLSPVSFVGNLERLISEVTWIRGDRGSFRFALGSPDKSIDVFSSIDFLWNKSIHSRDSS